VASAARHRFRARGDFSQHISLMSARKRRRRSRSAGALHDALVPSPNPNGLQIHQPKVGGPRRTGDPCRMGHQRLPWETVPQIHPRACSSGRESAPTLPLRGLSRLTSAATQRGCIHTATRFNREPHEPRENHFGAGRSATPVPSGRSRIWRGSRFQLWSSSSLLHSGFACPP